MYIPVGKGSMNQVIVFAASVVVFKNAIRLFR
jgi:hypothetical protein